MKRKITAWFLLMLMVVFTTMAHSGLRYCMCKQVVFLGECECERVGASAEENEAEVRESCSCCVDPVAENLDKNKPLKVTPCSVSCVIDLSLELDDFILAESDPSTAKPTDEIQINSCGLPQTYELEEIILSLDLHAPRGSPPPFHRLSVPIYVRDSVYRL